MTYPSSLDISRGNARGVTALSFFGTNPEVPTTLAPITDNAIWRTPTPSNAVRLRIAAGGNAQDSALGLGARSVAITGLDADGYLTTEVLATAGASASEYTAGSFIRIHRAVVAESGTYGSQTAGSHYADIIIEDEDSNEWAMIHLNSFPSAITGIGIYSVPKGYNAYVTDLSVTTLGTKSVDIIFLMRQNILNETNFSPVIRIQEQYGVVGYYQRSFTVPIKFPELTDFGAMAKSAVVDAAVSISFSGLLERIE